MSRYRLVHFGLIVVGTAVYLYCLLAGGEPRHIDGGTAPGITLKWANHMLAMATATGCYFGFCMVVLAHALISPWSDARPSREG